MADPFFSNVSLLLHCDGANGSTTFVDSSAAARTVVASGNAQISTTTPKFGTGRLSSTTGQLTVNTPSAFAFGAGNFTVEGWVRGRGSAESGVTSVLCSNSHPTTFVSGFSVRYPAGVGANLVASVSDGSTFGVILASVPVPADTWVHWALVRNGNDFTLYQDGVSVGTVNRTFSLAATGPASIGGDSNWGAGAAVIDETRITNGVARYTANFSPPTAAFENAPLGIESTQALNVGAMTGAATQPARTGSMASTQALNVSTLLGPGLATASQTIQPFNRVAYMNGGSVEPVDSFFQSTVLLLHMDAAVSSLLAYDSSANPKVLASSSGVSISQSAFSSGLGVSITPKFGAGMLSVTGSATTQGLTYNHPTDFDMGVGDFTVEGWVYLTGANSTFSNLGASLVLFEGRNDSGVAGPRVTASAQQGVPGSLISIVSTFAGVSSTVNGGAASAGARGEWIHWAFTRQGNTFRTFAAGVLGSSNTVASTSKPTTSARLGAAASDLDPTGFSYFDDVRVTKGTARYTTTFTVSPEVFPDRGELPVLGAAATQTVAPFAQGATIFGAGFRSAVASQTLLPFPQTYLVSPPSRVAESSTTFTFAQTGALITTADRNLVAPEDPYYEDVAYLLHGDTATLNTGIYTHVDSGPYGLTNVIGQLSPSIVDAAAISGKAIGFAAASSSYVRHFGLSDGGAPRPGVNSNISTTEMRVRFDVLNPVDLGVPPAFNNPGQTAQSFDGVPNMGWFFESGTQIGLAGRGGQYSAGWTSITAAGSGFDQYYPFAPYVLQLKGHNFDVHGGLEVLPGWHNVTVVRDEALVSVYLDGVFDFSFVLTLPNISIFGGTFIVGADTSAGFAFDPYKTNLSAVEELRHTYGVARYPAGFVPATTPFPNELQGRLLPFTQTATVVHYVGPRQVVGTQALPAFPQNAQASTQPARQVVGTQPLSAFGQSAQASGVPIRVLGATQLMAPFVNTTGFSAPRAGTATQTITPFAQAAEVATTITAVASQALIVGQAATVVHTNVGASSGTTFVFAQTATAKALLALTEGQIVLPFGQSATAATIGQLAGAQLVQPFAPSTLVEGAYIPVSIRGYRVHPEARTITHP